MVVIIAKRTGIIILYIYIDVTKTTGTTGAILLLQRHAGRRLSIKSQI